MTTALHHLQAEAARLALRRALRPTIAANDAQREGARILPPCLRPIANDDLGPCWIDDEPATGSPNIDARNARYAQWEE